MAYFEQKWLSPNHTIGRDGATIDKIVLHHAATTSFAGIGATFQNRNIATSAHYGVSPGQVCQYVEPQNTAWAVGNWEQNKRSISIEFVNSSGAPSWDIADATLETGAELVANIAKYLGWKGLGVGSNVFYHSDFFPTACPGVLKSTPRGQYVVDRANAIIGGGDFTVPSQSKVPVPRLASQSLNPGMWLYHDYNGNWRNKPSLTGEVMATYPANTWVKMKGYVHGEAVDGDDRWLVSDVHGWFAHVSIFGGVYLLPDLGKVNPDEAKPSGAHTLVEQHATFKATDTMNIRREPSVGAGAVVGTLAPGETVNYEGYIDINGYRWISYMGNSGMRCYIARRNLSTGEIYGECY